jgi:hypothetical protein
LSAPSLHNDPESWRDRAACAPYPTHLFVLDTPAAGRPRPTVAEEWALAVCARCPVATECLDEELAVMAAGALSFGVRGGTIAPQRVAMLRARARLVVAR